jgi:hypothetical protein
MKIKAIVFAAALSGGVMTGLAQDSVVLDGHNISLKSAPPAAAAKQLAGTLTTDSDIAFKGVRVPKGTYTLYVLTDGSQWQLAVNKARQPGAYDAKIDVGRVAMTTTKVATPPYKFTLIKSAALAAKVDVVWKGMEASTSFHLDRGGTDSEW